MKYNEYYIIDEGAIDKIADYFDIDRRDAHNIAKKFGTTILVIFTLVGLYNYNKLSDYEKRQADKLRNNPGLVDDLGDLSDRPLPSLDGPLPPLPGDIPVGPPPFVANPDTRTELERELDRIAQQVEQSATWDEYVEHFEREEGVRTRVYRDTSGNLTIGIGHLMTMNDRELFEELFGQDEGFNYDHIISGRAELTREQVDTLFEHDLFRIIDRVERAIPEFNNLPGYVQIAITDGFFRGDLSGSPRTLELINNGDWDEVSAEYLDNNEYRASRRRGPRHGVWQRMDRNAAAFQRYADSLESQETP